MRLRWEVDQDDPTWTPQQRKKQAFAEKKAKKDKLYAASPKCHYCGKPLTYDQATLDHVVARVNGGSDRIENLVIACYDCNHDKGCS